MAFFPDLSPQTYCRNPNGLEILNIGWLDEGNAFPVGATTREFKEALLALCQKPILLHRGYHLCYFCRDKGNKDLVPRGNGQIRVLGSKGVWYSAPTLVYHYVVDHQYLPPEEFIEAVLSPVDVATK